MAGYQVAVVTRVRSHGAEISGSGVDLIPFDLGRRFTNPLAECAIFLRLLRIYRREKPTITYHVGMKPVVYGSLAARIAGIDARINAIAGLGSGFTSRRLATRLLKPFLKAALRMLLGGKRSRVIVQNRDDQRVVTRIMGGRGQAVVLVPGVGVDLAKFLPSDEPLLKPTVLYAGRILWDKGVGEFVAAAEQLRRKGVSARFVLVGAPDDGNPSAVPLAQIERWQKSGLIEWWGHREDMPVVFADSHLVCLPSFYGEGIPKVLIEAAACARAVITTDIPGCREIVRDGVNGLLVPPRNVDALADAIETLICNPAKRRALGTAGRKIAEAEYGLDLINRKSLEVVGAAIA